MSQPVHIICPGCKTLQRVEPDGKFAVHGGDARKRSYCPWAGRLALDRRAGRNLAAEALKAAEAR